MAIYTLFYWDKVLYIQSKKKCFIIRGKSSGGGTLYNRIYKYI